MQRLRDDDSNDLEGMPCCWRDLWKEKEYFSSVIWVENLLCCEESRNGCDKWKSKLLALYGNIKRIVSSHLPSVIIEDNLYSSRVT